MPGPGTILDGRFELLERIGSGGMGSVYRARQMNVDRLVAVKMLNRTALQHEDIVRRFEVEARIISELRHPNTLKLHDFGRTEDGHLYIVVEHLEGRSLADELGERPMDPLRVVRILRQASESLAEAHERGIVHRDLKPANIFLEIVGSQEIVKVLDFGIAKLAQEGFETAAGEVFGTPAFISPEQVSGQAEPRSDLYSLGVVAYRALTGRLPFTADNPLLFMMKHAEERPVPPSRLDPPVPLPEGLETLLMSLLAKSPAERPASASSLASSLARIERHLETSDLEAPAESAAAAPAGSADRATPDIFETVRVVSAVGADGKVHYREVVSLAEGKTASEPEELALARPALARVEIERVPSNPGRVREERTPPLGVPRPPRPAPRTPSAPRSQYAHVQPRESGPRRSPWILLVAAAAALGVWWWIERGGGDGSASGELLVTSTTPGAAIIVNGLDTGKRTPAKLEGLPLATPVRVTVQAPGFVALPRESVISLDRDARYDSVSFQMTGGRALKIASRPPSARVRLDGVLLPERTPAPLPPLPLGEEVTITVELEGYVPASRKVTITSDLEDVLEVTLERASRRVR